MSYQVGSWSYQSGIWGAVKTEDINMGVMGMYMVFKIMGLLTQEECVWLDKGRGARAEIDHNSYIGQNLLAANHLKQARILLL